MRHHLAAPVLAAALAPVGLLVLALAPPVLAFGPGCPELVTVSAVRPGDPVTVWGSYTDWADPGTVTASFSGPGGRTRVVESANLPDGTYDVTTRFEAADAGAWTVEVTFAETAGNVTCRDSFRVVATGPAPTLPATDAEAGPAGTAPNGGALPGELLVLGALGALGAIGTLGALAPVRAWPRGDTGDPSSGGADR